MGENKSFISKIVNKNDQQKPLENDVKQDQQKKTSQQNQRTDKNVEINEMDTIKTIILKAKRKLKMNETYCEKLKREVSKRKYLYLITTFNK